MLRDLLARDGTVMTHAPTRANRANLADDFLRLGLIYSSGTVNNETVLSSKSDQSHLILRL